ncbi:nitroreductase [Streptomyces sp. NPDC058664]|uniref:nitroreductase family protein n=1 Tax=unclassified Streptomyces TaxID=2593676 RepID=UPI0036503BB0
MSGQFLIWITSLEIEAAIKGRRSEQLLIAPAPSDEEFSSFLRLCSFVPDHGRMRPWRWILVRGAGRQALGRALSSDSVREEEDVTVRKMLRAPLVAALVFRPRPSEKVPEWEQLASTSAAAYALMLILHGQSYGSIWRTGSRSTSPAMRSILGISKDEQLLGTLDIGTPLRAGGSKPQRQPLNAADHMSVFPFGAETPSRRPTGP